MPENINIPDFNVGDAFSFIKVKEGRIPPHQYVLKKLKQRDLEGLSIPEDLEDHKDLHFIYKLLYAPQTLTKKDITFGPHDCDLDLGGMDIEALPEGLKVASWLYLNDCAHLKKLPSTRSGFKVGCSLDLQNCISLKRLPVGLSTIVLDIRGCWELKKLPNQLSVNGLYIDKRSHIVKNILKYYENEGFTIHGRGRNERYWIKKYVREVLGGRVISIHF